tara:strand:+ start:355 stop:552 length:198 start_codon:yes stop_codon:yes gene_type:complete
VDYDEIKSWFQLELENENLESMLTVYQDHIEVLEEENDQLKKQVLFLEQQLEYKTLGLPVEEEDK